MPVIRPRSCVPHPSLRVRWGWVAVVGFVILCSASAFPNEVFPLMFVLLIAWLLWRGERDSGCAPSLRKEKRR